MLFEMIWYLGVEPFHWPYVWNSVLFGHSSLTLLNLDIIETICATWRKCDSNFSLKISAFLAWIFYFCCTSPSTCEHFVVWTFLLLRSPSSATLTSILTPDIPAVSTHHLAQEPDCSAQHRQGSHGDNHLIWVSNRVISASCLQCAIEFWTQFMIWKYGIVIWLSVWGISVKNMKLK